MEKPTPHYDLCKIKLLLANENSRIFTSSAQRTAANLGFSIEGIIEVIAALKRCHFYKSMTTNRDSRLWQDVYKIDVDQGDDVVKIYLKVQIANENSIVISFKENES